MPTDKHDIAWPLAGISRRMGYQNQEPYSCVEMLNCRNADVFEQRLRGGSRPGLARILPPKTVPTTGPSGLFSASIEFLPTKDLTIASYKQNSNLNGSTTLIVGHPAEAPGESARMLLHFDLDAMPANATIASASLNLFCITAQSNVQAKLYRLTRTNWSETLGTWNKYDGVNTWTGAGAEDDYELTTGVDWFFGLLGWQTIGGVGPLTQDAYSNQGKQLHLLLKIRNITTEIEYCTYHAREFYDNNLWPKLLVNYTVPA